MSDTPNTDPILELLIGFSLVEHEQEFRAMLENLTLGEPPSTRDLVIAMVSLLMMLGGIKWPTVIRTITELKRLSPEELREAAVGMVNGSQLYIPSPGDEIKVYDLVTLRQIVNLEDLPPALVTSVYSLTGIWEKTEQILG